jgi:hypothetical protein
MKIELLKEIISSYIVNNHGNIDSDLYNELCDLHLNCSSNKINKCITFTEKELSKIRMALISVDYYNEQENNKECSTILLTKEQVTELKEKFGFPTK